jgi:N-acetylneuraminic acid mutarotase
MELEMKYAILVTSAFLCSLTLSGQPTDAIQNWTAPPFWTPAKVETDAVAHSGRQALALPSSPLPFVAINPCRVLDTRNPNGPYGGPIFAAGEARTYALASANPCTAPLLTGIAAFSLNITVTSTAGPGFVEAYPSGVARPLASNVNFLTAGAQVGNAAVVPTDGTANNDIDIYASQGTHIIVDMNGYFAPQGIVNHVNGLAGDVTIAAGANVSITPSANTLTIAAVAGGGGPPSGPAGGSLSGTYPNPGITTGAVGPTQLANATAVRSINGAAQDLVTLQGSGDVSVLTAGSTITIGAPSGSMVLGAPGDTTLIGAGYTEVASTSLSYWTATTTTGAPSVRAYHTAVWTGSRMIVWGGYSGSTFLNDGGQYDPAANAWTATATTGAPSVRGYHTAVWTGSRMIVWGGFNVSSYLNDGGQYDPGANTWTATTTAGAPSARYLHTAVWTGSRMIVWGGASSVSLNDGGQYAPGTNTWTATTTTSAPSARIFHTVVWTGSRMIVWGGGGSSGYLNDGGQYDPVADIWTLTTTTGAPSGRQYHTAVWTGSKMIVWGGLNGSGNLNGGGQYDPVANAWNAAVPTPTGAPSGRYFHTAIWTGSRMVVWGGYGSAPLNDGGQYDPVLNTWAATATTGAPSVRTNHTAVWTGPRMIVWGGLNGSTYLNDGGQWGPVSLYVKN